MNLLGHGIDLVAIARIERMLREHGDRFLHRVYTPAEQAAAADRSHNAEHLAGRFAAKEAVLKALGTGWRDGIAWTDIEIVNSSMGKPLVRVSGVAGRIAEELGVQSWVISISHARGDGGKGGAGRRGGDAAASADAGFAMASVLALGGE